MPAKNAPAAVQSDEDMPVLSEADIEAVDDRPVITLPIPEWHGKVKIQGLSYDALQHARQQSNDVRKGGPNEDLLNAWCLTLGMVEPRINVEVAKQWIMKRSFGSVNTILSEILNASGLGKRAADAAKSASA